MPAASITASIIVSQTAQRDGRTWVSEQHTDNVGVLHFRTYLAAVGADLNANMAIYAARLAADLNAGEVASNAALILTTGSVAGISLSYSLRATLNAQLAVDYLTMTGIAAIFAGDYLNALTDAQIAAAFGLTLPAQQSRVTAFRAKVSPQATTAAAVRAAVGSAA